MKAKYIVLALFSVAFLASCQKKTAKVFFIEPKDHAVLTSPVHVKMGAEGIKVEAAGEIKSGSGHHHLIINGGPIPEGEVVPKDDTHLHFGKGQTETDLELEPGDYTLTLQFADGAHKSYGPKLASTIHITVKEK